MKMSTKGRYGLRVMIDLAENYGRGPILVEAIAARQGVSAAYIHVLVGGLKAAGLLRGVRGRSGGYEIAKPPSTVTALEVVEALEGKVAMVDCAGSAPSTCPRSGRCVTQELWADVGASMSSVLAARTLADLAERQSEVGATTTMYHI